MKRILFILLTSLVIVIGFVCFKYYVFSCYLTEATYGMRAICNEEGIKDFFIGSSVFKQGISANELGEHSYLLAYNSNSPYHEAMQVNYLLDNGAEFERLIVDMYPYCMSRDTKISDVRMLMDGDIAFTLGIYSALGKNDKSLSMLYDMIVLENNEFFITFPISFRLLNSRSVKGSTLSVRHGNNKTLKGNVPEEGRINEQQFNGVERLISICREKNIEIVFLETPKYYKIMDDACYAKIMEKYSRLLAERHIPMVLCEKTKSRLTRVIDNSLLTSYEYNDSCMLYFTDYIHLSYEGRKEFTRKLLKVL